METFQAQLTRQLSQALTAAGLPNESAEVTPATDRRFGDYQTNAALVLAKQRGENPRALAQKIVAAFSPNELCEPPQIAGAGFINFSLTTEAVARHTAQLLQDERLGVAPARSPKHIVIDFGSPNVAKPMHIGHIRSTVIGDSLARVAEFLGHDVIRDNHIGDWGTQFGMVIWGWKHLLDRNRLTSDPIGELVRIYKETNERGTADPAVRDACRDELVKLQAGDPENFAIWQECVKLSLGEFDRAYKMLGVRYDMQRGESFYNDRLAGVVDRLLKSGLAEISEGAVCVFFRDIPELADKPCIIRKRDGGYNYATTDIATVDYRIDDLKRDTIWIETGAPQQLHFQTNLRDRAPRRTQSRFSPHHQRQHPRRRPQTDENAHAATTFRCRTCSTKPSCAREKSSRKKIPSWPPKKKKKSRASSASARSSTPISRSTA